MELKVLLCHGNSYINNIVPDPALAPLLQASL